MNNKGFTLMELLAAIIILSLIVVIAVPSISNITSYMNETQRRNVIKRIEAAASNYARETKNTIVFVEELVKEGYLDGEENGDVYDPVNHNKLNCYAVEMTKNGDYYDAKFIDKKNYDDGGECNTTDLHNSSGEVMINISGENTHEGTNWVSGENIVFSASSNNMTIDCNTNKCEWTSKSGAKGTGASINVKTSGVLNTAYTFRYTLTNNTTKATYFTASRNILVDNQAPIISNATGALNRFQKERKKTIHIEANDGSGSGIKKGFYLGKSNGQSCGSIADSSYKVANYNSNAYREQITSNGTYLVCVKDLVGNVASLTITINTII